MGRHDERGPRLLAQPKGIGQEADGLRAGRATDASLQILHAAGADAGPLSQRLLRQPGGKSELAEEHPERRGGSGLHSNGPGALARVATAVRALSWRTAV